MPVNNITSAPTYIVSISGATHKGTAKRLLETIRKSAQTSDIKKMTTSEYASALIRDAAFFLPQDVLVFLNQQHFRTEFDKALRYLSEMPTSGVRVLTAAEHQ